ncbi:hypothetical protein HYS94_03175 [Candidatus Daviesbacteria bacterium]|nr:hypothetical protein [Candidatus Daviesbacteria bacterium]MBI4035343.1 hypothetical protein [Candidatus Daviesbacteria bacterium]
MNKAILKTLVYADIFDYPLNFFEIHKWLIGRKANLRQVEKSLGKLVQSGKCQVQSGYYFLLGRKSIVVKRKRRERQSLLYIRKVTVISQLLKIIPWIKLVGISGGLAMENAEKGDDIDLIVITAENRLWISRLLALGLLSLTGQRRTTKDFGQKIAGKICLNILLEEDCLEQKNKDLYTAHEVLQMRVIWERDGVYSKYLSDNEWVFKFLPNWIAQEKVSKDGKVSNVSKASDTSDISTTFDTLEAISKWFQLKIMQKSIGQERIQEGALYFHPNDIRPKILRSFKEKLATLDI